MTQSEANATATAMSAASAVDKRPAGLLRRLAAMVYDSILLAGLSLLYAGCVLALRGGNAVAAGTPWFTAGLLAILMLFFCWFWTHGGQTLGMVAWKIRVEMPDGAPPGWGIAALRFAAAWLALLPAGLGFLWILWDSERAAWHDRLSGTRVVRTATKSNPASD